MSSPIFKVRPTTQQYDWGKLGLDSKVAQLAANIPGFVAQSKPYAELWMGTHPTSPSTLSSESTSLSSYLASHPSLIGEKVTARFPDAAQGNLPFLFKVLSIAKALSIQTHPDKKTAEFLHKTSPGIYKDDNHKPELALAITPFRGLCGFLPLPDIAKNLGSTPELSALIPEAIRNNFLAIASSTTPEGSKEKTALKDLFSALMNAEAAQFRPELRRLIQRYSTQDSLDEVHELVLTLDSQFPGDIGVFCAFMLNYIKLEPEEAIFLGAGEPHAYISGDIIECMANSDNVIRAGLTPKLRDIPNLIAGLTYLAADGSRHHVKPAPFRAPSSQSQLYDPPIPDFSVVQVKISDGGSETHPSLQGPSLVIVTEGSGDVASILIDSPLEISIGDVFFIGADTQVTFNAKSGLVLYRAFVES